MSIGGINKTFNTRPGVFVFYDDQYNEFISNSLGLIVMGNQTIHKNAGGTMPELMIDSGSTFSQIS